MRTANDFLKAILRTRRHPEPGYGGNVLPAIRLYSEIASPDEVLAYQAALEKLLGSDDEGERKFAVNVCLGFFTFYDVVPRPVFEENRDEDR